MLVTFLFRYQSS